MATKGTAAKAAVIQKIKEAFGDNFVGDDGKKIYVWSKENGEKVQVAIALTIPKTPYGEVNGTADHDWTIPMASPYGDNKATAADIAPWELPTVEVKTDSTEDMSKEVENLSTLLERLGL
jgi:hypothetical protein